MLTKPEVDEAKAEASSQILHFDPIFAKKNEIFGRLLTGLQNFGSKRALT